jgi:hypothetical protein
MNKWKYDTREWEDFANFAVGISLIMCGVFVLLGIAFMAFEALGIVVFK